MSFKEQAQPDFSTLDSAQVAPDACLGLFFMVRLTSEPVSAEVKVGERGENTPQKMKRCLQDLWLIFPLPLEPSKRENGALILVIF